MISRCSLHFLQPLVKVFRYCSKVLKYIGIVVVFVFVAIICLFTCLSMPLLLISHFLLPLIWFTLFPFSILAFYSFSNSYFSTFFFRPLHLCLLPFSPSPSSSLYLVFIFFPYIPFFYPSLCSSAATLSVLFSFLHSSHLYYYYYYCCY